MPLRYEQKRKLQTAGKTEFVFAFEWTKRQGQVTEEKVSEAARKQGRRITPKSAKTKASAITRIFKNHWEKDCLHECFHIKGGQLQKKAEVIAKKLYSKYFPAPASING